jgi:hypothetical protein
VHSKPVLHWLGLTTVALFNLAESPRKAIEGQVTRYAYVAPAGRTATELLRNYKLEFARLGLETLYEKGAGAPGWFGPTLDKIVVEDGLSSDPCV